MATNAENTFILVADFLCARTIKKGEVEVDKPGMERDNVNEIENYCLRWKQNSISPFY